MDEEMFYGMASVVVALFAGLTIFVPVTALTLRFALRPLLETWARTRQGPAEQSQLLLDRRMSLLEGEVQQMQQMLQSLTDAQEFQRQLEGGPPRPRALGSSAPDAPHPPAEAPGW